MPVKTLVSDEYRVVAEFTVEVLALPFTNMLEPQTNILVAR